MQDLDWKAIAEIVFGGLEILVAGALAITAKWISYKNKKNKESEKK